MVLSTVLSGRLTPAASTRKCHELLYSISSLIYNLSSINQDKLINQIYI